MKIEQVCNREVTLGYENERIDEIARRMRERHVGSVIIIPREGSRKGGPIGVITDRDIAVRAIAKGKSAETPIREVMSEGVCYCFDVQELSEVAANMGDIQIRRLPVLNRDKRLVGILSLGDLAMMDGRSEQCAETLSQISQPTGGHTQTA